MVIIKSQGHNHFYSSYGQLYAFKVHLLVFIIYLLWVTALFTPRYMELVWVYSEISYILKNFEKLMDILNKYQFLLLARFGRIVFL